MVINIIHNLYKTITFLKIHIDDHKFIPKVIEVMEFILNGITDQSLTPAEIVNYAWGIERYISDDMAFCETDIGIMVNDLMNSVMNEYE